MIDLSKKQLPDSIQVSGRDFKIHTDFQYFIILQRMMKEVHTENDFDFFFVDKVPVNKKNGIRELIKFMYPPKELPRILEEETDSTRILDYEQDSDLIYSAFYSYYGIDLADENLHLHWYKFYSLLNGIKGTKLNDIIEIRQWKPRKNDSAEYKAQMKKLKAAWELEEVLTDEEKAALEKFENIASGKNQSSS